MKPYNRLRLTMNTCASHRKHAISTKLFFAFVVLCVAVALSPTPVLGQQEVRYFPSGPGFVLLTNGEVLQGEVQAYDRELEIKLDDTGKVRFTNDKVSFVGKSLDELYLFQANRITKWAVGDHLKIGRWCTQQRMFDRAMPHYELLKQQIPDRPEFKQFQTELRDAMLRDQNYQTALKAAGYSVPGQASPGEGAVQGGMGNNATIVSASQNAFMNQPKSQQVSRVDIRDQEIFRTDIHPVLVSSCARAACHGAFATNGFALLDSSRVSSRDALGKNLSAFTNYVNSQRGTAETPPEDHPLYQKSVNRHGQMLESPLDVNDPKHQKFMEQIRLWVARANSQQQLSSNQVVSSYTVGAELGATQQASHAMPVNSALVPKFDYPPTLGPQAAEYFKARSLEAQAKNATPLLKGQEMESISAAIARLEQIENQRANAADPFDPADFNARFATPEGTNSAGLPETTSTK